MTLLEYFFTGKRYPFVLIGTFLACLTFNFMYEFNYKSYLLRNIINHNFALSMKRYNADRFYTPAVKIELCEILYRAERKFNLDHKKVLAHWGLESKMNPRAIGYNPSSFDGGLGQINSRNVVWLSKASKFFIDKMGLMQYNYLMQNGIDIYNPVSNAFMSISYMVMLEKRHGNGWRSVIAYNAGSPVPLVGCFRKYYNVYTNNYNKFI